jgi:hypothetical protein
MNRYKIPIMLVAAIALAIVALVVFGGAARPARFNFVIEGPVGFIAPRDTLPYTLRWGRATNATSYKVQVTAAATPAGPTAGLPGLAGATVPDTVFSFTAVNLTFDSLRFTASVTAYRGTIPNPIPAVVSWSVVRRRPPGPPGPIQIDSSQIPPLAGIEAYLNDPVIHAGAGAIRRTTHACVFFRSLNGHAVMRSQDGANCWYKFRTTYTAEQRIVNTATQMWVNAQCVQWRSSNPAVATVESTKNCA